MCTYPAAGTGRLLPAGEVTQESDLRIEIICMSGGETERACYYCIGIPISSKRWARVGLWVLGGGGRP